MSKLFASFNDLCQKCFDGFINFFRKHILLIVFIVLSILALVMRILFFQYLSGDMASFLIPWTNFFKENGNFLALAKMNECPNANYLYGYYNLLAFVSIFKGEPINLVKSISVFFDFALAIGVSLVTYHFTKNKTTSLISYLATLYAPTVFANSAVWGQCDQIYVCFVVYAFLLILKKKNIWATLVIGIALGFKIQTIFILPLLGFMWLNKKYRIWNLFMLPLGFLITILPSYLVGGAFTAPFEAIGLQLGQYADMNYGSGSMYAFMEMGSLAECFNKGTAIIFAAAILLFVMFVLFYKKVECNEQNIMYVAALYALLTPFVLPHMHERYFFMADIFILLYVIVRKKQYYLAPLMIFSSINTYTHFLTFTAVQVDGKWVAEHQYIFKFLGQDSVRLSALINLFILIVLFLNMKKLFNKENNELTKTTK
ncbi:MAG: hypothetical protein J1F32_06015 [Erysipelotrichales bacterium]|nr:hypothetical protein [Erysipelotrichales bacterium]